jgi:hypothetical protein
MANTRQYSLKSSKNLLADSTTIRDEFGHTDGVNVGSHDWGSASGSFDSPTTGSRLKSQPPTLNHIISQKLAP